MGSAGVLGRRAGRRRVRCRWPLCLLGLALAGAAFAGCGDAVKGVVIARVGRTPITRAELSEWMRELAPEHFVPDPPRFTACVDHQERLGEESIGNAIQEECRAQYEAVKAKALRFLISSQWLIQEARAHGLGLSASEVSHRLQGQRHGGAARSRAARRLMLERELAAQGLTNYLQERETPVSRAQVLRYYATHVSRFERRERRYFDIIENLRGQEAGKRIMDGLAHGRPSPETPIHEVLDRPRPGQFVRPTKRPIYSAIFRAAPHRYVGPLPLNGYYAIFRVTRVIPRVVVPLSRARKTIDAALAQEAHRSALKRFLDAWTARWTAATSCRAGYVVLGCRQYRGSPTAPEVPSGLR
jgi:hypothetical protein